MESYSRLLKTATGVDTCKAFVALALGGNPSEYLNNIENAFKLNGKCAIQLFIDSRPGTIKKIKGLDEIRDFPFVISLQEKCSEGNVIPNTGDVKQRIFEIDLLVDDNQFDVTEAIHKIQETISVKDNNDLEMIVSPIDLKMLY